MGDGEGDSVASASQVEQGQTLDRVAAGAVAQLVS